ncbi:MAG TPA: Arc family DNA-binding protein [Terriglobales bacterium]|nr:Arc family DNA-binding protein [Terriglobales bacterium]
MNLTIKDLPEATGELLRSRAAAQGRSLNREVVKILVDAGEVELRRRQMRANRPALDRFRASLPRMGSSVPLLRADRNSR